MDWGVLVCGDEGAEAVLHVVGEVAHDAAVGGECQFPKIDFAVDIVEVDAHLRMADGQPFGKSYHFVVVFRFRQRVADGPYFFYETFAQRCEAVCGVEVFHGVVLLAACCAVVAYEAEFGVAVEAPELVVVERMVALVVFGRADGLFGNDVRWYVEVVRFDGVVAVGAAQMAVELAAYFPPVGSVFVVDDDGGATVVGAFKHKAVGERIDVDVVGRGPDPEGGNEILCKALFGEELLDFELVGIVGPEGGVAVELKPLDFFVESLSVVEVERPAHLVEPISLDGALHVAFDEERPERRFDDSFKAEVLERADGHYYGTGSIVR